jgi:hypothetical protein
MKKLLYFIFLILGTTSSCFSQNINLKESQVIEIICKVWEFDYGLMNGNQIQGLEPFAEDRYIFKADKTYILTSQNSSVNGTWKYDIEKKYIQLNRSDGGISGIIKFVNEKQFVLVAASDAFPKEINMEFYFKSKL